MTDYPKFASITAKATETVQERRTAARERGWAGDKKEGEKKNFCAHIIFKKWRIKCYLHHGGFVCRSPPDQPCGSRGTSHDMRVAQFTSLVREANLGRRKIIMWVSKLVWGKVAAAFDIQYFNFFCGAPCHCALGLCDVLRRAEKKS